MRVPGFNLVDRLEIAVRGGLGANVRLNVEQLEEEDLALATELAGLRWQLWHELKIDVLMAVPALREWRALQKLRVLAAGSPLIEQPLGIPDLREAIGGFMGVLKLPERGAPEWRPNGPVTAFQQELQAALRDGGVARKFSYALASVLGEMASNAVEHACSPIAPLASFSINNRRWAISVTDVGQGARQSLIRNAAFRHVRFDTDALRLVMLDGVSGTGDVGRGHGFTRVFKALVDRHASLRFRSGGASADWEGDSPTSQQILLRSFPQRRQGFHVAISGPV